MKLKKMLSNPLKIFLLIWFLIIITFSFKIAYFFPSLNYNVFLYPVVSIVYFAIGFFLVKIIKQDNFLKKTNAIIYIFSIQKFYLFLIINIFFICTLVLINIKLFGLPPFFSFFGYKTYNYLDYGRFKGVLFALSIFLFAISFYLENKKISLAIKLFSLLILLLYVSRGNIIFSILIYFYLIIFENKIENKKLFFIMLFLIFFIIVLFQIIGEFRTGTNIFYNSLEIKEKYRIKNSGLIWLISYLSMPYVNFLELTKYNDLFFGVNIISRSLPAFLNFNHEAVLFYKSIIPNKYNTVSTYLSPVYLDFGIIGVIIYNFFLGAVLSYVVYFGKNNIIKAILMTCLSLIFFVDYFLYFTTIILLILGVIFFKLTYRRKCIKQ